MDESSRRGQQVPQRLRPRAGSTPAPGRLVPVRAAHPATWSTWHSTPPVAPTVQSTRRSVRISSTRDTSTTSRTSGRQPPGERRPRGPRADWTAVCVDREPRPGRRAARTAPRPRRDRQGLDGRRGRPAGAGRLGTAALVEIGGDVAVAGEPARPWRVDVAEVDGGPAYRVDLTHGGLATSSVLAREWTSGPWSRAPRHRPAHRPPDDGTGAHRDRVGRDGRRGQHVEHRGARSGAAGRVRLRTAGVDARLVDSSGRVTALGAWPAGRR